MLGIYYHKKYWENFLRGPTFKKNYRVIKNPEMINPNLAQVSLWYSMSIFMYFGAELILLKPTVSLFLINCAETKGSTCGKENVNTIEH